MVAGAVLPVVVVVVALSRDENQWTRSLILAYLSVSDRQTDIEWWFRIQSYGTGTRYNDTTHVSSIIRLKLKVRTTLARKCVELNC